ncbi:uncharacterized protein [Rutidosis leptorrhynchoides]|uniref:uncharacterized protein n=1 Tax=Rutidosis leptorrhynchoides TaxID=125765 RepID=UPI003A99DE63
MFSSSNNFPSSTNCFLSSSSIFFNQDKDGVYFNNNHSFITGDCSFDHAPVAPHVQNSDNNHNHDYNHNHNHNHNHVNSLSESMISSSPSRKRFAGSKKDRHSKILTAQGPRDRRVRLSIDISKKLFGLQDLLGFDKASKTLDWLFTKSKTAIKELVQEMKHTSSSSLSNQCEQVFMEKGDFVDVKGEKKKVVGKCVNINAGYKKKKKTTQKQKPVFHVNVANRFQLRAEARARARERTIEKLRIKKLENDVKNMLGNDHNYCYLQSNQAQSQSNYQPKIGESFFEQKVPKPYSLLYNSQQNFVAIDSKDSSSQI